MIHFLECSTVAANCNTETQIETRDGLLNTSLPALVLDLRPVMRSRCSFSCIRSRASCSPTAFMSVRWRADVMYLVWKPCYSVSILKGLPNKKDGLTSGDIY